MRDLVAKGPGPPRRRVRRASGSQADSSRRSPSSSTRSSEDAAIACTISSIATACCTPRTSTCRAIADEVGTPFYCYSTATLERHYRVFAERLRRRDALVCYAMKANSNQAVLRTLARLGAGMDIVSEGELRRALAAGVPGERIVFSGVGKTRERDGGGAGRGHPLLQRRVASPNSRCSRRSRPRRGRPRRSRSGSTRTSTPRPTTRSRPASPRTSSASRSRSARAVYARAAALPGIRVTGVDMHIGSQITDLRALRRRDRSCWPTSPASCAATGHAHRPHRSRRRARHSLPRGQRAAAADPSAYAAIMQAPHAGPRPQARVRDRALIVGNAGMLVTARRLREARAKARPS